MRHTGKKIHISDIRVRKSSRRVDFKHEPVEPVEPVEPLKEGVHKVQAAPKTHVEPSKDAYINKKVLIVEDERPVAKILQMKLKHEGIESDIAFDGQMGIDKLQNESYDFVVLDLIMPIVDGFTVLETMRDQGILTPTIVASNLSQLGDKERSESLGALDYFIKSNTSLATLVERIKQFLN